MFKKFLRVIFSFVLVQNVILASPNQQSQREFIQNLLKEQQDALYGPITDNPFNSSEQTEEIFSFENSQEEVPNYQTSIQIDLSDDAVRSLERENATTSTPRIVGGRFNGMTENESARILGQELAQQRREAQERDRAERAARIEQRRTMTQGQIRHEHENLTSQMGQRRPSGHQVQIPEPVQVPFPFSPAFSAPSRNDAQDSESDLEGVELGTGIPWNMIIITRHFGTNSDAAE